MIIITSTHSLDSIEKTISTLIQQRMWKIRLRTNYEAMRMNVLFKFNMEFRGQMLLLFCLTKSFLVVHEFLTRKTRALTSHLKTIYNQKPIMGFWYNRINVSELFFFFNVIVSFMSSTFIVLSWMCWNKNPTKHFSEHLIFSFAFHSAKFPETMKKLAESLYTFSHLLIKRIWNYMYIKMTLRGW